jgi:hypothetical protein
MYAEWHDNKTAGAGGARKKSSTLRTRKSIGDSKKNTKQESDDEFHPTKSAPRTKSKGEEIKARKQILVPNPLDAKEKDQNELISKTKRSTLAVQGSGKGKERTSPKRKM